jgi:hypothetical protein
LCASGCFFEPHRPAGRQTDAQIDAEPDAPPVIKNNIVFVTSSQIAPATLAGPNPLAAADAECMSRANLAGLSGTFKAWLSTTMVDAKDRLSGARGWVRTDGRPVVDTIDQLLAGAIFYPPSLDERSRSVDATVMTGTTEAGVLDPGHNCTDYSSSSASDPLTVGRSTGSTVVWTSFAAEPATCDQSFALYCFGTDHNDPLLAPPMATGKLAFVSQSKLTVGGAGIGNADNLCNADAQSLAIPGTFKALIGTNGASPQSRFTSGGPWVRRDGVVVTTDLSTMLAPINETLASTYVNELVWTGASLPDTTPSYADTCGGWGNIFTGPGRIGRAAFIVPLGFGGGTAGCFNDPFPIYCLDDSPP